MLPLIVCAFVLCFIAERLHPGWALPAVRGWWWRVLTSNAAQLAIVLLAGLTWERWLTGASMLQLSAAMPAWLGGLAAYGLATFVFYWWHRARHEVQWLWLGFHQIHHSPQRLEVITSFYQDSVILMRVAAQARGQPGVREVAMFMGTQEAIRIMKAQSPKGGRIINNGSISAHAPRPMSVAYTSTKHAVTGLTKCISLDGRKDDITASQIDIGNALTELAARMAKGVPQADGSIKPEPLMDVKHVGDAVLHMANLPLDVNVQFMTIMATKMPFVGRG